MDSDTSFRQEVSLRYLEFVLKEAEVPVDEFFGFYRKLHDVPDVIKGLNLTGILKRCYSDQMPGITPSGNIQFEAEYDMNAWDLNDLADHVGKKTGLALDDITYWENQEGRGSFLYRFSDKKNIARVVLNPSTPVGV